jgi:hypothetical protein
MFKCFALKGLFGWVIETISGRPAVECGKLQGYVIVMEYFVDYCLIHYSILYVHMLQENAAI